MNIKEMCLVQLKISIFFLFLLCSSSILTAQNPTEVIQKLEANNYGGNRQSTLKMTIIRPKWQRTMQIKSWSENNDKSIILITGPARDKGVCYLKLNKEMWNFQPNISRTIKLPPSMLMQSWMGSDFKNDDLIRQSTLSDDYTHKLLGKEIINGANCLKIELMPKPDAPVVWGKIILWIDPDILIALKSEYYDEDMYLINTIESKKITRIKAYTLPLVLELTPAEEEGHKTIIEYSDLQFDLKFDDRFFSIQNMKRIR